jgi:hypothetical protein
VSRDPAKERIRLLGLLDKEKAELEWPCGNPVLRDLVSEGLAARVRDYEYAWGGRNHKMSTIAITDAGRAVLGKPA